MNQIMVAIGNNTGNGEGLMINIDETGIALDSSDNNTVNAGQLANFVTWLCNKDDAKGVAWVGSIAAMNNNPPTGA